MRKATVFLGLALLATAVLVRPQPADPRAERLARHLNLGKAFYENPGTQKEAVEEFRQALALQANSAREHLNYGLALLRLGQVQEGAAELEKARSLDPKLPHPYFNLGVLYKRQGDYARALKEFEQMARLAPEEPVTRYNLGAILRAQGQVERAIPEFERAAQLDPTLAAPHFQLFNVYRQMKRAPESQRALARFQEIKKRQADLGTSEDMDWSYYSEILDTIEPAPPLPAPLEVVFQEQALGTLGSPGLGLAALDADADGRVDLLAWSAQRVVLYRNGPRGFAASPVPGAGGPVAVGDFNNDGLPDFCAGARLYANRKGAFVAEPQPLRAGSFQRCLWVDYDHDYDLDLLLLGPQPALLRNNGDGTWADVSASFPFVAGEALDGAVLELIEDNSYNLAVAYQGRPAVLYRDRKMGRFEAAPLGIELAPPLLAGDFNQDGLVDIAAGGTFLENQRGTLRPGARLAGALLAFADFQNRGRLDALTAGGGLAVARGGFAYEPGKMRGAAGPWAAAATADFNGDGLVDAAVVKSDGAVLLLRNATPAKSYWMRVGLAGVKSLKLAYNARVEVKAGTLYQKQIYQGVPLVFGLGANSLADTVRITWPNGLIQNEARQKSGPYVYKEAPRLSGSCPMIFTWNGRGFEFISDVLGVAPLGVFFPLDHDEYVQIPGRALAPRDGAYEVRLTEELREVSYLDQIRLTAVDHPAGVEVFTGEKFQGPPFPEFRLFETRGRISPVRAVDDQGRDVLERVARADGRYLDGFPRDLQGRAATHSVAFEFPARAYTRPVLLLRGWVDWADSSVFVAASQGTREALRAPYLQVKDAAGRWVTVLADLGMPSGKPKTIAVDLTGKLPPGARELRIVTSMCVYWDEISLGEQAQPRARLTEVPAMAAELRFRGFSAVEAHPARLLPEQFDYALVRPAALWDPTPGAYTRYGEVRELLARSDDRLVVMGSGDELRLRFPAAGLAPLPAGWRRDFLLYVDGWAKDADPNTAAGSSVEPLPFHAMRGYPETGPHPEAASARQYNTRPALRLIRPLAALSR